MLNFTGHVFILKIWPFSAEQYVLLELKQTLKQIPVTPHETFFMAKTSSVQRKTVPVTDKLCK